MRVHYRRCRCNRPVYDGRKSQCERCAVYTRAGQIIEARERLVIRERERTVRSAALVAGRQERDKKVSFRAERTMLIRPEAIGAAECRGEERVG